MNESDATTADGSLQYFGRDLESMSFAENYYRWILREISPYFGKRLLEVGAGSGTLTERLLQFGPESITALEPSKNMFPVLRQRFAGSPVVTARGDYLSDCAAGMRSSFDTAIYINVLEHVPDDRGEMRLAVDSLAPGGHLLIFVPALPWLFGTADELFEHHRRYTKAMLAAVMDGLELEVIRCRYFDVMGVLPWWIKFVVLRSRSFSPGMVRTYDRLVVPWAQRMERISDAWPLGKNLLLVARKRA